MKTINLFSILLSIALQGIAGISGLVKADKLPPIQFHIAASSASNGSRMRFIAKDGTKLKALIVGADKEVRSCATLIVKVAEVYYFT
jgi:hypothetical protein